MKDMGRIETEIQSDANARDRREIERKRIATDNERISSEAQLRAEQLPAPLAIDDMLELAAKAKSAVGPRIDELSDSEAFQLGEGYELLSSDLEEERKQRAAEQAAHAQVTRETADEIARLCTLVDELRCEMRASKDRGANLERRIAAANDQAAHDMIAMIGMQNHIAVVDRELIVTRAAAESQHERDMADLIAATQAKGARDMPVDEIAWFVARAREEQRTNAIIHPLAALADLVEMLHAGSLILPSYDDRCTTSRLVRWDDLEALMSAVARTPE